MIHYNTAVVLAGTGLLGASAGLVGCFAVLRRRALVGDALAHAALPGLCLAFLLVEASLAHPAIGQWLTSQGVNQDPRKLPVMLAGALASGLVGLAIVTLLRRATRIKEDAAIGVVLSVFFGAGVALSGWIQKTSPSAAKAGLDSYILGKTAGMIAQDVLWIGGVAAFCLGAVLLLYKEFKLVAFDGEFARAQGWPATWLDLLLMGLVAVAVVIGLPAVGVVLMAAMLILPAVTARMWTDRLSTMLWLASAVGMATGLAGTLVSAQFSQMPAGPIIVLVGTALFLISAAIAPTRGVLARMISERQFERQLRRASLLTALDKSLVSKRSNAPIAAAEVARREGWSTAATQAGLTRLVSEGILRHTEGATFATTTAGAEAIARAARGTRLWRHLITEHPDVAAKIAELDLDTLEALVPAEIAASASGGGDASFDATRSARGAP